MKINMESDLYFLVNGFGNSLHYSHEFNQQGKLHGTTLQSHI